jgi:hypothetical protein
MKTMKLNDKVERVKDADAPGRKAMGWQYCPKSEYKLPKIPKVNNTGR